MKKSKWILTLLFIFGVCAKEEYTEPKWSNGEWCEYKIKSRGLGDYTLRYAIVGEEKDEYWFEMRGEREGSKFIYKMLVPYGFRGKAKRMIIKVGEQQAVELINDPEGEPPGSNRPFLVSKKALREGKISEEKVKTTVGEFQCIRSKVKNPKGEMVEIWVENTVPLFRLVKFKSADEEGELIGWGIGATTEITEKPKIIDLSKLQ